MISSGSSRLLKLLEQPVEEVVPKGWKTVGQWAKEIGIGEGQTGKMLRQAANDGVFEKRKFRVGIRPIDHYKKKG